MIDPHDLSHEELIEIFNKLQKSHHELARAYKAAISRSQRYESAAEQWYDLEQQKRSEQGIFG